MIDPRKKGEGADPLRHLQPGGFTPPTDAETRGPGRGPEALDTCNPRPGFPTEAAASPGDAILSDSRETVIGPGGSGRAKVRRGAAGRARAERHNQPNRSGSARGR